MPRIAFILKSFYGDNIGGAERQVQLLSHALRAQGWKTSYICERKSGKPGLECVEGMEVLALPFRKKRSTWLNYGRLREAMVKSGADLFYQRVRYPYTGLAAHIARRLGKPFVYAASSTADLIRKEDWRESNSWRHPVNALLHPVTRFMEDWGILHADEVILQTNEQLRLLERYYQRRGTVIPNHILMDRDSFYPKRTPPEVLWISNLKRFKRPELFLDLARRCSDLDAKFVMAGACMDNSLLPPIRDFENEQSNFAYIGPLEPSESEKCISASTLLVNTSRFEGFPNAFQQAWSHGVPTLSLGVDPDGVIVREGLGGCSESLDGLERIIRQLLSDENKCREIGERARRFAHQTYDVKLLLPHYLSLFERLLEK